MENNNNHYNHNPEAPGYTPIWVECIYYRLIQTPPEVPQPAIETGFSIRVPHSERVGRDIYIPIYGTREQWIGSILEVRLWNTEVVNIHIQELWGYIVGKTERFRVYWTGMTPQPEIFHE